ncbi:hypothetical protein HGM15179_003066, partial [Zosterops borbonicus]
ACWQDGAFGGHWGRQSGDRLEITAGSLPLNQKGKGRDTCSLCSSHFSSCEVFIFQCLKLCGLSWK